MRVSVGFYSRPTAVTQVLAAVVIGLLRAASRPRHVAACLVMASRCCQTLLPRPGLLNASRSAVVPFLLILLAVDHHHVPSKFITIAASRSNSLCSLPRRLLLHLLDSLSLSLVDEIDRAHRFRRGGSPSPPYGPVPWPGHTRADTVLLFSVLCPP